jgi:hypothetical protein
MSGSDDDVQILVAKKIPCSTRSLASCNDGKGWPELGSLAGMFRASTKATGYGGFGPRVSYQKVQNGEAGSVAKQGRRRCSGAPAISRRSCARDRQDLVRNGSVVLWRKRSHKHVSEVLKDERDVLAQSMKQGEAGLTGIRRLQWQRSVVRFGQPGSGL